MSEITQVLQSLGQGVGSPAEDLLPLVYGDLRRHAAVRMAHESGAQTLQPTALLHEAWLRLFRGGQRRWQNSAHFFGAAAEAMRRILIENARRKARFKRGGGQERVDIDQIELAQTTPAEKVLLLNEALDRLQAIDPGKARIVVLKFFGGYSNREAAESLGVTERTVERQWAFAKAWLFESIREEA